MVRNVLLVELQGFINNTHAKSKQSSVSGKMQAIISVQKWWSLCYCVDTLFGFANHTYKTMVHLKIGELYQIIRQYFKLGHPAKWMGSNYQHQTS